MTRLVLAAALSLMASTAAQGRQHDHALMHRGQEAMGFDQARTTHHFVLQKSGGTIEITAKDPDDRESASLIRQHLAHIREAFDAGNFTLPMFIHATEPPGVKVLERRRDRLDYRDEAIASGGRLVISTADREALAALHEFLRFQIAEQKTGDPLQPK